MRWPGATRGSAAAVVARSVGGDPAERRRRRLLAAALTGCSAFGLAAVSIAALATQGQGAEEFSEGAVSYTRSSELSPFVAEPGLRVGVVTAAVLLVVPFAVLAVQVLRLGSASRERRLAALRLQGATAADLRRIAAAEVRRPALAGAAAGLPGLVVLWLVFGVLPPAGGRLLPPPGASVVLAWPVLVGLLTGATVLAARRASRAAGVDALGGVRRRARPLTRTSAVTAVLLLVLCVVVPLLAGASDGVARDAVVLAVPVLLVAMSVAAGPWLVVAAGRYQVRRADPVRVLAGRRLLADPRTPGRVAGVLLAVGLAIGLAVTQFVEVFRNGSTSASDLAFYGGGTLLALLGIGLAAVVAAVSLVVGAGEQILDARRPTAALVALGAGPGIVTRVVRSQLQAAAVAPAMTGAVVGGLVIGSAVAFGDGGAPAWVFVAVTFAVLCATIFAGATATLGAAVAARLLRRPLAEAMAVESLRTA